MKRILSLALALVMVMAFAACGAPAAEQATPTAAEAAKTEAPADNAGSQEAEPAEKLSVCLMLNGFRGDHGLMDSAASGVDRIAEEFPDFYDIQVVEAGYDSSNYEAAFIDICDQNYDIVITGLWSMKGYVIQYAPEYPDTKFIIYDSQIDYVENPSLTNVHSITYKQNEGAFLAGAVAALCSNSSEMPKSTGSKVIATVGGSYGTTINDFMLGYISGAQHVDPDMKVLSTYIASVSDAPKCKDASLQMYAMNADFNFSPSGGATAGAMDAAREADRYVIGCDADQAMQFAESDPEMAHLVVTSALKNAGQSIYIVLSDIASGKEIAWGTNEVMGLDQGAVGIAKNEIYNEIVPQSIRDQIDELEAKIISGEIKVPSAFDITQEEYDQFLIDAAK